MTKSSPRCFSETILALIIFLLLIVVLAQSFFITNLSSKQFTSHDIYCAYATGISVGSFRAAGWEANPVISSTCADSSFASALPSPPDRVPEW